MIRDRNIDYARKRIFRNAWEFPTWLTATTTDSPVGAGTGAAILDEIGSSGIAAAKLTNTGDIVPDMFIMPYDLDEEQKTHLRVYWATAATPTTDDCTFVAKYGVLSNASAVAVGTTALDTVLVEDRSAGANKLNITGWGTINAEKLSPGKLTTVHLDVSACDLTISSEFVYLVGYEIEYTPHKSAPDVGRKGDEASRRDDISY